MRRISMSKRPKTAPVQPAAPAERAKGRMEQHPAILDEAEQIVAETFIAGGITPGNVIVLTERGADLASELTARFAGEEHVACRAGCAWCCRTTSVAQRHLRSCASPRICASTFDQKSWQLCTNGSPSV